MKAKDLVGMRFGMLTVVERGENTKSGKTRWVCRCDCGKQKEKPVTAYDLTSGKVKSCGCFYKVSNRERNMTHGKTGTRLYVIWSGMKQRCNCNTHETFRNYGANGISICEEWRNFQVFYDWAMANGYTENLTIDRIENDKGYSPENCRWATMKEQQNNRRNNVRVSIGGEEKTLSEWSEASGIQRQTLANRINSKWAEEDLLIPVNLNNKNIRKERKVC